MVFKSIKLVMLLAVQPVMEGSERFQREEQMDGSRLHLHLLIPALLPMISEDFLKACDGHESRKGVRGGGGPHSESW